jgi:hypothetical protein
MKPLAPVLGRTISPFLNFLSFLNLLHFLFFGESFLIFDP